MRVDMARCAANEGGHARVTWVAKVGDKGLCKIRKHKGHRQAQACKRWQRLGAVMDGPAARGKQQLSRVQVGWRCTREGCTSTNKALRAQCRAKTKAATRKGRASTQGKAKECCKHGQGKGCKVQAYREPPNTTKKSRKHGTEGRQSWVAETQDAKGTVGAKRVVVRVR